MTSYIHRSFTDDSTAFSDCNSDISGEFPTTSSESRRLFLSINSDVLIQHLITQLESSPSADAKKQAAMELRLLAKNKPENRLKIVEYGAVKPLISIIMSSDTQLQEHGVTAVLNLSLCDENKEVLVKLGAIEAIIRALKTVNSSSTTRENAACSLLRLSNNVDEYKYKIGRAGALPLLVSLLEVGSIRGKKDACTAIYSLCSVKENKVRAVECGVMKVLVEMMADLGSSMVDKCAFVVGLLVGVVEGRVSLVEEGGIPVLVEILEVGTQRQKEIAVVILLQVCGESVVYRTMVAREGAIPPLVALTQSGTSRAKQKAQSIYRDEHKGVLFSQVYAWAILRFHPKWDAPEQVDLTGDVPGASQEDLFGHDARPRPAGKPRPAKKTKSDATASTGGSSASTQFGELMEQELRLKREAAERAFEAQAEKDRTLMRLEELRFLATSTKDLDDDDAYWIKKQKQLIKNKMRNDLGDEDDEDE
ncbi:U-box domain-containing protein 4-like protein [Tanacetum coccineum]